MVWAGVSANGRTKLIVVPQGVKINGQAYRELILEPAVKTCSTTLFNGQDWVFVQDGAPAHTQKQNQEWCRENLPNFIDKEEWPPSSPDLNVMDYCVWAILEQMVSSKSYRTVEALTDALKKAWAQIPQETLRAAVNSFPNRLKSVIKQNGGIIESY